MDNILLYIKFSFRALLQYPRISTLKALIKYASAWHRLNDPVKILHTEKLPWLCLSAIDRMKKILHHDMILFEYGSGASTVFWSSRVKAVISIEHDKTWYEKTRTDLNNANIRNVTYILAEAEPDNEFKIKSFRDPADYISDDINFTGKNFETYVKQIDHFADQYFDMIIIDGRARPSCIAHALQKVKTNGFIIIDNTDRKYYLEPFQFNAGNWDRWDFTGPVPYSRNFSKTTILQKKK
jgi:hypothetical protein